MIAVGGLGLSGWLMGVVGCHGGHDPADGGSGLGEASAVPEEPEDSTGEAASGMVLVKGGALCEYSCGGAVAAGCAAVTFACTAGTLWAFGGISIPCQYAVVAACYGMGAAGVACAKICGG